MPLFTVTMKAGRVADEKKAISRAIHEASGHDAKRHLRQGMPALAQQAGPRSAPYDKWPELDISWKYNDSVETVLCGRLGTRRRRSDDNPL